MENLNEIKKQAIGLFKVHGKFELILEDYGDTIDTIRVTELFAIQRSYGTTKYIGESKLFPDGKKFDEILNDPFLLNDFINSFK